MKIIIFTTNLKNWPYKKKSQFTCRVTADLMLTFVLITLNDKCTSKLVH